jgi:hypothetical protein
LSEVEMKGVVTEVRARKPTVIASEAEGDSRAVME